MRQLVWATSLFVLGSGAALAAAPAQSTSDGAAVTVKPAYDAFYAAAGRLSAAAARDNAGLRHHGYPSERDARLGSPTFLWAGADRAPAAVGALQRQELAAARARDFLKRRADALGLSAATIDQAVLSENSDRGQGPAITRFKQQIGGIEVFRRQLNVMTDRSGRLVAISGYFAPDRLTRNARATDFVRSGAEAAAAAFADLGGQLDAAGLHGSAGAGGYTLFQGAGRDSDYSLQRPLRAKPVWYALPDRLVAGWYVEVFARSADRSRDDAYSYVISANDGSVLYRHNLKQSEAAFSYRVYADASGNHQPYDSPLGNSYTPFAGSAYTDQPTRSSATTSLVTLSAAPTISTQDPWLADDAVTTSGNNVNAYLDLSRPDGFQASNGDFQPPLSGPLSFDYAFDADSDPTTDTARSAAVVNLFYLNNWLHDFWYDHGFDEAAGNAQASNYDRGGVEGDAIAAQGQDYSGFDNANMSTPADGGSPRMQMYLWQVFNIDISSPALGKVDYGTAQFGPTTFDVSGTIVAVDDGQGADTADACEAIVNGRALRGHLALINRGSCSFQDKALRAQFAGASGVIIVNNVAGAPIGMAQSRQIDGVRIPTIMISQDDGQAIKDYIGAGNTASAELASNPQQYEDGTQDNQIISHEFFHYVSNRLVNDGNGLGNNQGGGMGEGWSDFDTMLLTVRPEDLSVAGNDHFQGAYPTGVYAFTPQPSYNFATYYYGIRRTPYSTDLAIDPLTFGDIQNGVPLPTPTNAPLAFGADGANNAEVHNTGEIWANMLWEAWASLLNDPRLDFTEARNRIQDYVIGGLKMTPTDPTFTEARDGILAAAEATDCRDYADIAAAFAKRGLGLGAVAPARDDDNNGGPGSDNPAVEDFTAPDIDCSAAPAIHLASSISAAPGATASLDASGTTVSDSSTLSYQWRQLSGTPVSLDGADTATASFVSATEGSYSFRLTVTSSNGNAASANTTVTVATVPPTPPSNGGGGDGGGGAFDLLSLLALAGVAARRRQQGRR